MKHSRLLCKVITACTYVLCMVAVVMILASIVVGWLCVLLSMS